MSDPNNRNSNSVPPPNISHSPLQTQSPRQPMPSQSCPPPGIMQAFHQWYFQQQQIGYQNQPMPMYQYGYEAPQQQFSQIQQFGQSMMPQGTSMPPMMTQGSSISSQPQQPMVAMSNVPYIQPYMPQTLSALTTSRLHDPRLPGTISNLSDPNPPEFIDTDQQNAHLKRSGWINRHNSLRNACTSTSSDP